MRSLSFLLALFPVWACNGASPAQTDGGNTGGSNTGGNNTGGSNIGGGTAGGGTAGGGTGGGADAGPARPLACLAIFDCATTCNDDPCSNACVARGSTDAQQAAIALATCFTDHACADAACLETNCQVEVDACVAQGRPMGTPLAEGGGMPGSVPTELVGSWVHAAYGETDRIKLNADGTGYYQSGLTSLESCAITQDTVWDGTAVVDPTTITIYATTVTNTRFECGHKSETTSPPQTLHFAYAYDASTDVLSAIDNDCAAQYPDSPSSQSLYCKNAYTRE